jgi:sugar phosphate isomerase/epimerase
VVTAGADPKAYLQKHKNRFRLCHVKDRAKDATPQEHDRSVVAGTGSIDYASLLKVAKATGMKYYIIEQERYDGTTPLQSAKDNAAYMSKLKF